MLAGRGFMGEVLSRIRLDHRAHTYALSQLVDGGSLKREDSTDLGTFAPEKAA